MKKTTTPFMSLAVIAVCLTCPAQAMSPAKSLQTVSKVFDTINTYWKPVAGTVTVVGAGYWLWSYYNQKPSYLPDHDLIQHGINDVSETF